jgi:hypothetical protein
VRFEIKFGKLRIAPFELDGERDTSRQPAFLEAESLILDIDLGDTGRRQYKQRSYDGDNLPHSLELCYNRLHVEPTYVGAQAETSLKRRRASRGDRTRDTGRQIQRNLD